MRVAVGGVVLVLDAAAAAQREAWLRAHGLEVVRWLGADVVLVASPHGPGAVWLADRLISADGVVLAMPNWWRPGVAK